MLCSSLAAHWHVTLIWFGTLTDFYAMQLTRSSLALHFDLVWYLVSVSHGDRTQHTGERSHANTFWVQLCSCDAQEESCPRRLKRREGWQSHRVC